MTVSHEDEPFLIVQAIDADAEGSFADVLELMEMGEQIQRAQESGVGQGRLLKLAFDAIRPRLAMSDGSDPAAAIKRVSISRALELIQQLSGTAAAAQEDAVPPTNGGPSGGPPSVSAKSNGHRLGSKSSTSRSSGTPRPK